MSKKKLAFYDAFRQKPEDSGEQHTDSNSSDSSTSSKSISGFVPYTPGEELTIRPRKHIPTSHHSVAGQNIEVRAKGSSMPPGVAQKYQTPNVNRSYLPSDSSASPNRQVPTSNINVPTNPTFDAVPVPPEENLIKKQETVRANAPKPTPSIPKAPVYYAEPDENVKPISHQSETMPYLDSEDLETQKLPLQEKKRSVNMKPGIENSISQKEGEISLTPPVALALLVAWLVSMVIMYFIGSSFHSENSSKPKLKLQESKVEIEKPGEMAVNTERRNIGEPIVPVEIVEKPLPPVEAVDNSKSGYIIQTCSVASMSDAKAIAVQLEARGIKPTFLKQTRQGVILFVGPFETTAEASKMLKVIKFKSYNGHKPYESAFIKNETRR